MSAKKAGIALGCVALVLFAMLGCASAIAVVSIDFGSEWMKIGLVKPGVPMEIVLNTESQRKTAVGVSFVKGERAFADFAVNNCVKDPLVSYRYLLPLLGQQANSAVVTEFLALFPFYDIRPHPERGTVVFHGKDSSYTVEELVAMILEYAVELAAKYAEQPINSVTITVPPFFTQAQRKAMLIASKIAKINVMQLINSNTAVAINYGVFRRSEFNETAQNVMFYDIGAGAATATVVAYSAPKKKGSKTGNAQLEVRGVGFDASLGGLQFDHRLEQHLLAAFKEKNPKLKGDPAKDGRVLGKFLKEAQRVKKILSANVETYAQIENAYQDTDFRLLVTRTEFETLVADLFDRIVAPLNQALAQAELTTDDISQLVIVGGSTRIPRIQAILQEWLGGRDLGKSINADEAASMGAAYQIAVLSKGFRVKEFAVKDMSIYPIDVVFDRTDEETGETAAVTRTLFHSGNSIPQKKLLSFHNMKSDFSFAAKYGNLSFLTPAQLQYVGSSELLDATVKDVASVISSRSKETAKGIKVHFQLNESGVFSFDSADAVFEPAPQTDDGSILGKLSSLLGGEPASADTESKDGAGEQPNKPDTDESDGESSKTTTPPSDEAAPDTSSTANATETSSTESANTTDTNNTSTTNSTSNNTASTKPSKPKTVRVALSVSSVAHDSQAPSDEEYAAGSAKLNAFTAVEEEKRANEAAKNALESFIYNTRDKIEAANVIAVSTDEERSALSDQLSSANMWLEEDSFGAATSEFTDRLTALNKTARPIFYRLAEQTDRPEAIARLQQILNMTDEFVQRVLNASANSTADDEVWIKPTELGELVGMANDTRTWFTSLQEKQSKLSPTEDPVLKSNQISLKTTKLERELLFLFRRPKPRPKPKIKVKTNSTKTSSGKNSNSSTTNSSSSTISDEELPQSPIDDVNASKPDSTKPDTTNSNSDNNNNNNIPNENTEDTSSFSDKTTDNTKDDPQTEEAKEEL